MRYLVFISLLLAGIILLLPAYGALGPDRILSLYGTPVSEPNIEILMRHRAVLFGLIGAFLVIAAFRPELRATAFITGHLSFISFLLLAWTIGGYNAHLSRVVVADLVGLASLIVGAAAFVYLRRGR